MTNLEIKAIEAMTKLLGNEFTLQPDNLTIHRAGYLFEFYLSNGDQYLVKVYDDKSPTQIFKNLNVS